MIVKSTRLPDNALSKTYEQDDCPTDCFYLDLPKKVTFQQYVAAFYTTSLFKTERGILALFGNGSSDKDAFDLASRSTTQFAIWTEEARTDNQLLMCDLAHKTRSWLMTETTSDTSTRLYFGSVVVPSRKANGEAKVDLAFHLLGGFHTFYSKKLLKAAAKSLLKSS